MIREIDDLCRQEEKEYDDGGGRKRSYKRPVSLDPMVYILRNNGERIAEGKLPFG